MEQMKIKDIPKNLNLTGCKIKGKFIISAWNKGFWTTDNLKDYQSGKNTKIEPIFFKDFDEIKNWDIKVPLGRI